MIHRCSLEYLSARRFGDPDEEKAVLVVVEVDDDVMRVRSSAALKSEEMRMPLKTQRSRSGRKVKRVTKNQ